MFLRKLTVMVVPLLLLALLCVTLPLIAACQLGFFAYVVMGILLGVALALLLPLSGATHKREPFAGLLWVPTLLVVAVVVMQYLAYIGKMQLPLLATNETMVIFMESAFVGYMGMTCVRTIG